MCMLRCLCGEGDIMTQETEIGLEGENCGRQTEKSALAS